MMNPFQRLHQADPVGQFDLEHLGKMPALDELLERILAGEREVAGDALAPAEAGHQVPLRTSKRNRHPRRVLAIALTLILVATGLAIGVSLSGDHQVSANRGVRLTQWHPARQLPSPISAHPSGTTHQWQLVSMVASQGWQVGTSGPPPGQLTCPSASMCYAIAVQRTSPSGDAAVSAVSLYVSSDLGTSWAVLPMPAGFLPTSALSCPTGQMCAIGGVIADQSVLVATTDGGHQWSITPESTIGTLGSLVCVSATSCTGVTVSPAAPTSSAAPASYSDVAFVHTDDSGQNWATTPIPVTGTVRSLVCTNPSDCIATLGESPPSAETTAGSVLISSDGGESWQSGTLPSNFYPERMSCSDSLNCMMIGISNIANPDVCVGNPPQPPPGVLECDPSPRALVSVVATTSDGGATWQPRTLPTDVPMPQLTSVSCVSTTVCSLAGSQAVPMVIGNVHNAGSPVVLGTTDGGATWTASTFTIPPATPDYLGQSFLTIGSLSCPATNASYRGNTAEHPLGTRSAHGRPRGLRQGFACAPGNGDHAEEGLVQSTILHWSRRSSLARPSSFWAHVVGSNRSECGRADASSRPCLCSGCPPVSARNGRPRSGNS